MKESETAIWIHRTGTMQMKQQRATLEKRKAPKKRQKRECCGSTELPIVVARRSWSEISGGKLGTLIQQTKNSLNFVSTCLKVVDTRRITSGVASRSNLRLPPNCWRQMSFMRESFTVKRRATDGHSLLFSWNLPKSASRTPGRQSNCEFKEFETYQLRGALTFQVSQMRPCIRE
jgi:hypothetical protein